MQRHPKEERLKFIRREYKRLYGEVDDATDVVYSIPLEKPQFAGWEMYVDLSESGRRRSDAAHLVAVLSILGISKPRFIRSLNLITTVRRSRYNYLRTRTAVTKKQYLDYYSLGQFYDTQDIGENRYNGLKPEYRKYFRYSQYETERKSWTRKKWYVFDWHHFPAYELVFKLKKSYWTHLTHKDGDAISEYTRLKDKLWDGSLRKYIGRAVDFDNRYRDDFRRHIKCCWRNAVGKYKTAANSLGVQHEEWYEIEESILRYSKVHNSKAFGWD